MNVGAYIFVVAPGAPGAQDAQDLSSLGPEQKSVILADKAT